MSLPRPEYRSLLRIDVGTAKTARIGDGDTIYSREIARGERKAHCLLVAGGFARGVGGKLSSAKFGSEKRFIAFCLEKKKKPFRTKVVVNRFEDDPAIARTFTFNPILYRFDGPPRRKAHAIMNLAPTLFPPRGIGPLICALPRFSSKPPFTVASSIRSFPAFPLQAGEGFIFVTRGVH